MWSIFLNAIVLVSGHNGPPIEHCIDAHIIPRANVDKNIRTIYECLNSAGGPQPIPLVRISSELGPSMQKFLDAEVEYSRFESKNEMENLDVLREFKGMQRELLRSYFGIRSTISKASLAGIRFPSTIDHTMYSIRKYTSSCLETSKAVTLQKGELDRHLERLRQIKTLEQERLSALEARELARTNYENKVLMFKNVIRSEYGDEFV